MSSYRSILGFSVGGLVAVPVSVLVVLSASLGLLTGCSGSFAPGPVEPTQTAIGNIQGSVHGGQWPVTGAQIYLLAAGTGGYDTPTTTSPTASTSLITASGSGVSCSNPALSGACYVTTDSNGNFSLVGDYTCTEGQQVYLVAVGGNPGVTQGGFTTGATFSSGSTTISVSSATWINVGMTVSGTGVGGTVTAVNGTTVTLSQKTTSTAATPGEAVTFSVPATTATFLANSSTITVASNTGISIGMTVSGTGVSGTITAISGNTLTVSPQTTAKESTPVAVTFTTPVSNTGAVQMAGAGQCPSSGNMASQVPRVVIDEVTTVAFAYAMGPYGVDAFHISAPNTTLAQTGIANAMANANNIVSLAQGVALSTASGNSNSVAPQAKLNTLANIVSSCVNTSNAWSSLCLQLFPLADNGSTQPTDESTALFNIVHNQTRNVAAIYNLFTTSTQVFSPYLSAAPTDWTMPVVYTGVVSVPVTNTGTTPNTITSGPYNLVFDKYGNAWIGDRINGVVEVGPQGAVTNLTNSAYGFGMVKGVAVSPQDGTIWVSDFSKNKINVIDPTTNQITGSTTAKLAGPVSTVFALPPIAGNDYMAYEVNETTPGIVAFDSLTYGSGVTHYAGNTNSPQDYSGVADPGWIYVDSTGVVWIPSTNTTYAGELAVTDKNGTQKYAVTDLNVGAAYSTVPEQLGMAADGLGNVWAGATVEGGTALYKLTGGASTGAFAGGGLNAPNKTAIDGGNNIWVGNGGANTVSGFSSAGSALATNGFSTSSPGITTTGTFSSGSTSVTVGSATGILAGATVSGTGIASGTTVSKITGTTVTLSKATTASGSNAAVTFGATGCLVLGIDLSGNVWTGNSDESVTQLLGLATPTAAPLYGGKSVNGTNTNGNLGTEP